MSQLPNGGPAFPHDLEKHDGLLTTHFYGMSLRDYFAAMALQGLISRGFDPCADTARMSFQMADAMLKERVK